LAGVTVFIEGKLTNPLNGKLSRAHWSRKSEWAKAWKERTAVAWLTQVGTVPELDDLGQPKRITFTAYVGSPWDDDSIPAAIKPIRDALIGRAIFNDAPKDGHTFVYRQQVCRGLGAKRGVEVSIAAASPGPGA